MALKVNTNIKKAKISWSVTSDLARNNPDQESKIFNWQDIDIYTGKTHTPNIAFEMFQVRNRADNDVDLWCLNTYNVVTWGEPENQKMLEMTDYTYVDSLEEGYKTAEEILDAIMRGVR